MKLSNIWKAWGSTLIGLVIGAVSSISQEIISGAFSWHTVAVGLTPLVVAALTDLLKEVQAEVTSSIQPTDAPAK